MCIKSEERRPLRVLDDYNGILYSFWDLYIVLQRKYFLKPLGDATRLSLMTICMVKLDMNPVRHYSYITIHGIKSSGVLILLKHMQPGDRMEMRCYIPNVTFETEGYVLFFAFLLFVLCLLL